MIGVEIVLCFSSQIKKEQVKQVAYGIEEEGIPYRLLEMDQTLYLNADTAANESALDVGIGISQNRIAIRNRRFEKGIYLFERELQSLCDLKSYGANAARLIKGVPFKKI